MNNTADVPKVGNMSMMESIQSQIKKAEDEGYNMLLPTQILSEVPAMHKITIEYEKIDPKPEKGDVYPKGSGDADKGKFILSKQALMRLCACAGIEWNWAWCKRTDDSSDRDYIAYRMVGAVRKLDGTWYPLQGQYDIDFGVEEDELKDLFTQKSRNWNKSQEQKDAYVRDMARKELLRKRKHKLALCETGAMLRAIRGLLVIRNSYTVEELEKPFVIARLAFQPDYNDPEIRREFVAAATQAITGVYGPSTQHPFAPKDNEEKPSDIHDIPAKDIKPAEESEPESPPEPEAEPKEPASGSTKSQGTDFANQDADGQVKTLEELIKLKGYDTNQLKSPLNKFTDKNRKGFFDLLMSMDDDDIPF